MGAVLGVLKNFLCFAFVHPWGCGVISQDSDELARLARTPGARRASWVEFGLVFHIVWMLCEISRGLFRIR